MGLGSSLIYLDSCLAIYLVEEIPTLSATLENALASTMDARFCISHLTEMECLIGPFRSGRTQLATKFEDWFQTVQTLPIDSAIFRAAARLRADFSSLRTPDALHLATAIHHKCDEFWTNDNRLNLVAPSLIKNPLKASS